MAHHSSQTEGMIFNEAKRLGLGPTGQFPRGKIDPADEGEIQMGVTCDLKTDTVLLSFGSPVTCVGMTADQANELACSLFARAMEIKTTAH